MYIAASWIGLCFFLLFSGFNALQALLPALRPQVGPLTIALAYLAYGSAALLPPVSKSDDRRLLFAWSAFSFVLWISATLGNSGWLAIASVLNGAGSGLLWTNEGAWIGDLTKGTARAGRCASIVLVAFHAATLLGQAIVYFQPSAVFMFALISSTVATIALLSTPTRWLAAHAHPVGSIQELFQSEWPWLVPEILLFGAASSVIWVALPKMLLDQQAISVAFAAFSVASVIGFAIAGQVRSDYLLALIGCTAHSIICIILLIFDLSHWIAYVIMAGAALANAALNQAIIVRQTRMPRRAFSCQVALYSFAYASCAAIIALQVDLVLWLELGFALCSLALLAWR